MRGRTIITPARKTHVTSRLIAALTLALAAASVLAGALPRSSPDIRYHNGPAMSAIRYHDGPAIRYHNGPAVLAVRYHNGPDTLAGSGLV